MKFSYKARTKQGELQEGIIDASSREAAIDILQRHDLVIMKLETESEAPIFAKRIKIFEKVKSKDVVIFSRQLATLFAAKVPLIESLQILSGQMESALFREIILGITKELEGGMALSQAMSRYPKAFSPFYISMVKSGELSGKLEEVLNYLALSLERQYTLASRIFNALIYPLFVLITFSFIIVAMFMYVVPKLKGMILESGSDVPIPTKVIFGISDVLVDYSLLVFPIIAISGAFAARFFFMTPDGKLLLDKFKLRAPVFGVLFQKIAIARFSDSLNTLISGGLPIVQAIEVTSDVVENAEYKIIFMKMADQVKKGFTMSSVLKMHPDVIPPMVSQMVFIGEETGKLEDILKRIADFYEKESARALDTLVTLIEPILIVFLGGFVFILVAAILLPIYNIANFTGGGEGGM